MRSVAAPRGSAMMSPGLASSWASAQQATVQYPLRRAKAGAAALSWQLGQRETMQDPAKQAELAYTANIMSKGAAELAGTLLLCTQRTQSRACVQVGSPCACGVWVESTTQAP